MVNNKNIDQKYGFSITYSFEVEEEVLSDGTIIKKFINKQPPKIKQDVIWGNGLPYLQRTMI